MDKLKFIHTADLHLDSPFKGLKHMPAKLFQKVKESTFTAFTRIIELAITEKVDFVLIAGDLFDHDTRSLRSQVILREGLQMLCNHNIQVYIIHGNHDHLSGNYAQISWPENVHIYSKEVEMKPFQIEGRTLAHIYGFSYGQRAVTENMTTYYQMIEGAPFHIGMLHGNLKGGTDHDAYAPFTVEELLDKQFDYWALGHIHKRQQIHENPPIIYPGNIQGRHTNEKGEKGCYVIELSKEQTLSKFIPVAEIIWDNIEISIDNVETFDQLIDKIQIQKNELRLNNRSVLLTLSIKGSGPLHSLLQQPNATEQLLELINDIQEEDQKHFIWTIACRINTSIPYDRNQLKTEPHFLGDLLRQIDDNQDEVYENVLMFFYKNRNMGRHLEPFGDEEKREIFEQAERLLLEELLKN
ncbi:metallophosphoesterase family protein [Bacillus sp. Marseille-P3661]|uniref:metallophosphoesterase family protein n=1 Tax=Bacillus sp. Marseille-P3661 TaxID=1936234 RepID=UPI000C81A974|nr:DNA repair exonuclease [Bacillus sp. Marseille-P3661]